VYMRLLRDGQGDHGGGEMRLFRKKVWLKHENPRVKARKASVYSDPWGDYVFIENPISCIDCKVVIRLLPDGKLDSPFYEEWRPVK